MYGKKRILVVENHANSLRSMKNYLMAVYPQLEIKYARNGREAVNWVALQPPDVVVMSIDMPRFDGTKATREIKAGWPEVKVILLLLDPKQSHLAIDAGADAYMLKGGDAGELIVILQEMGLAVE